MGSGSTHTPLQTPDGVVKTVSLPAPTAWPFVLAFGLALMAAGLVTSASVSIFGAFLAVFGSVGWFRDVLPQEKHESVSAPEREMVFTTTRPEVAQAEWVTPELRRARLPIEIYPVIAGVKGGLAGSVAMAILAVTYGLVTGHGIWYPINLLSAGFFPVRESTEILTAFHWDSLIIASIIHLLCSLLVGLLYGATLPMFPRRPILLGGLVAPILWSGLLHGTLDVLNPVLNKRIDWLWFAVSQIGFGLVAGIVVSRQERVRTRQHLPFAVRAGIEGPMHGGDGDKSPR